MAECYSCEHDKELKSNDHLPICEKKKVPNILIIDTMSILLKTRSAANFKTQRLKDGECDLLGKGKEQKAKNWILSARCVSLKHG